MTTTRLNSDEHACWFGSRDRLRYAGFLAAVKPSRRLCTAEARDSNPLGATSKKWRFAGKSRLTQCYLDVRQILRVATVEQHGPHIGDFVDTLSSLPPRSAARNAACGRRRPTSEDASGGHNHARTCHRGGCSTVGGLLFTGLNDRCCGAEGALRRTDLLNRRGISRSVP